MQNNEIFYFDVDGTLLDNPTNTVPESTIFALKQLKAKGYLLALCTGRSLAGVEETIVGSLIDWDGYVLSNGSLILDRNRAIIKEIVHDRDFIEQLLHVHQGSLLFEGETSFMTQPPNEKLKQAMAHFNVDGSYPIQPYIGQKIYNIMAYNLESIDATIRASLLEDIDVVADILGNHELIHREAGKHNGCLILNQHFNITRYTGFGDGYNDLEFLKNATFSVAMGNAVAEVKKVADYITRSVLDDGIYFALKQHDIL